MAEQRVLRYPSGEGGLEEIHVVDPLAAIRSFTEQVLVHVGDGAGIRVHAVGVREHALEQRAFTAGRHRRCDPWLHNGVAIDDATGVRVQCGTVERMGHLPDQAFRGSPRQPRIRVENNDVADAARHNRSAPADRSKRRVGGTAKQSVQLVQLPALAFPSDIGALPWVPQPAAMQQQEPIAIGSRSVAPVQRGDSIGRRCQQRFVTRHALVGRIRPIRKQGEADVTIRIGQMMNLQPLDLPRDRDRGRQQSRDDNHRAQVRRHALGKAKTRQRAGIEPAGGAAVHQRHGRIRRRDQREQGQHAERRDPARHRDPCQHQRDDNGSHDTDRPEIAGDTNRRIGAGQPSPELDAIAQRRLERRPSLRDEIIAGVPLACGCRTVFAWHGLGGSTGRQNRPPRDLDLRPA